MSKYDDMIKNYPEEEKAATWILARAISLYYYNVSAAEWASMMQLKLLLAGEMEGFWHPAYAEEAIEKYQRGFQSHFGELDFRRQGILLEVILERYEAEASKEYTLVSQYMGAPK